jgi:hypothetical protein
MHYFVTWNDVLYVHDDMSNIHSFADYSCSQKGWEHFKYKQTNFHLMQQWWGWLLNLLSTSTGMTNGKQSGRQDWQFTWQTFSPSTKHRENFIYEFLVTGPLNLVSILFFMCKKRKSKLIYLSYVCHVNCQSCLPDCLPLVMPVLTANVTVISVVPLYIWRVISRASL